MDSKPLDGWSRNAEMRKVPHCETSSHHLELQELHEMTLEEGQELWFISFSKRSDTLLPSLGNNMPAALYFSGRHQGQPHSNFYEVTTHSLDHLVTRENSAQVGWWGWHASNSGSFQVHQELDPWPPFRSQHPLLCSVPFWDASVPTAYDRMLSTPTSPLWLRAPQLFSEHQRPRSLMRREWDSRTCRTEQWRRGGG